MLTAGFLFVLVGILGLALPFIQGVLFIAIGLILLSFYSPGTREWMETHAKPYPKAHALLKGAERWIARVIGPL